MVQNATEGKEDVRSVNAEQGCSHTELLIVGNSNKLVYSQAAQALSTNHIRKTIQWHRIIRVYMGFSTRYPWRKLKVKFLNKNGLPYSIRVLFAPVSLFYRFNLIQATFLTRP